MPLPNYPLFANASLRAILARAAVTVLLIIGMFLPATGEDRISKRRREILRDVSDHGLGLSIRRHRQYKPAPDLAARRKALGFAPSPQVWTSLDLLGYYDSGWRFNRGFGGGRTFAPRNPLNDWRAPVVGSFGGRSIIIPGQFSPTPSRAWQNRYDQYRWQKLSDEMDNEIEGIVRKKLLQLTSLSRKREGEFEPAKYTVFLFTSLVRVGGVRLEESFFLAILLDERATPDADQRSQVDTPQQTKTDEV